MICYLLVGNKYWLGDALLSIERPFRSLHTIILSLRDRVLPAHLSRHFVPGYLHLVPTGHRRFVFNSLLRRVRAITPKGKEYLTRPPTCSHIPLSVRFTDHAGPVWPSDQLSTNFRYGSV
jgi:hypothetical protein